MKSAIAIGVLLAATLAASAQQRKTNPPYDMWCRDAQIIEGTVQVCSAYTLEQCLASRASANERCYLNPIYDPRFQRR